jgi:hypothetical protein
MWESILNIGSFIVNNSRAIVGGVVAVLTGIIAICMVVPGDQPEKFLQGIVDFISKFSNKPKDPQQ